MSLPSFKLIQCLIANYISSPSSQHSNKMLLNSKECVLKSQGAGRKQKTQYQPEAIPASSTDHMVLGRDKHLLLREKFKVSTVLAVPLPQCSLPQRIVVSTEKLQLFPSSLFQPHRPLIHTREFKYFGRS